MSVRDESDIEQLRRIALTQQTQIRVLLDVLQRQPMELDEAKGTSGDLQEKIVLLNEMTTKAVAADDATQTRSARPAAATSICSTVSLNRPSWSTSWRSPTASST